MFLGLMRLGVQLQRVQFPRSRFPRSLLCTVFMMILCFGASADELEDLNRKCLVEIKYQFVPKNCYSWVKKAPLSSTKKLFFSRWFDSVCEKAIKKNDAYVQYHTQSLGVLGDNCLKNLATAFEQWSYRSQVDDPEKVFQVVTQKSQNAVGKDLEYPPQHDLEKTKRYRNFRSVRAGLN